MSASTTRTSSSPAIFSVELFEAELAVATAARRTVCPTLALALTLTFLAGRWFATFVVFGFTRCTARVGATAGGVTTTGVYDRTGA